MQLEENKMGVNCYIYKMYSFPSFKDKNNFVIYTDFSVNCEIKICFVSYISNFMRAQHAAGGSILCICLPLL